MHVTKPVMAAEVICTKTPALIDPQLLRALNELCKATQ